MKTTHHFVLVFAFRSEIDGFLEDLLVYIRDLPCYWGLIDASTAERDLFRQLCNYPTLTSSGSTLLFKVSADMEPEEARLFAELLDGRSNAMDDTNFIVSSGLHAIESVVECVYAYGGTTEEVEAAMSDSSVLKALQTLQSSHLLAPADAELLSPTENAPAG